MAESRVWLATDDSGVPRALDWHRAKILVVFSQNQIEYVQLVGS